MRILVVEDNEIARLMIQRHLVELGHNVTAVNDGREALVHLPLPFDMMLFDIAMPHIDGKRLVKIVRAIEDYRNLIVAITTAPDDAELPYYFDAVYKKPVTREDILTIITLGQNHEKTIYNERSGRIPGCVPATNQPQN